MPIDRDRLRMDPDEFERMMREQRTLRAATASPDGWPHVVPLWFVWHDGAVWVTSLRKSRRARDLAAGSKVALCIDTGTEYAELRGAVLYGTFQEGAGHPALPAARRMLAQKYWSIDEVPELTSHVWLRLAPERVVSWDFRKMPGGRDRRTSTIREKKDG